MDSDSVKIQTPNSGPSSNASCTSNEIVVAGISCRLPESDNMEEFWEHLICGADMVTEDDRRWKPGYSGLPRRNGKLKDLSKFDAEYFQVNPLQAHAMDPQLRILLEVAYEAIVDAGISPTKLKETITGVYVGSMFSESLEVSGCLQQANKRVGYGLTGACDSMFSNYVSFYFGFKGPSLTVNTACSASLHAFDLAVQSLRVGQCQHAVVAGTNVLLKPGTAMHMLKLGMLSPDGACKAFDTTANGYVRSEGIVALFLTTRQNASRVYLHVLNSKSMCDGYKPEGITYPSGAAQRELILETCSEIGLDPADVHYVEAHGTGTQAGDFEECKALDEAICARKSKFGEDGRHQLLIGSVKTNMGHCEPTSGLAGIAKVALSYHHGIIPPNLHFNHPNPRIEALTENRLSVITRPTSLPCNAIVGLNSFGFGGAISHVVLKGEEGEEPTTTENVTLAFPMASRTMEGLRRLMDYSAHHRNNKDLLTLLSAMKDTPQSHRGYVLWNNSRVEKVISESKGSRRPVWLIFDGMGTQWTGIGKDLLQYPLFAKTIERCYRALPSNLRNIITTGMDVTCEHTTVLEEIASVCATTLALYELLKAVGITGDGLIGHSLGELTLCYADGSLTLEQCMQVAYWRVKCVLEANIPEGAMGAVGLSWDEVAQRCPEHVWPVCNNSPENVTISGKKEAVEKFLASLREEGIFTKMIKSSGLPFHSPLMRPAVNKKTIAIIRSIIPSPKQKSSKWVVSSVVPGAQQEQVVCSADFHINSLVNPVHFYQALQKIPKNAVVVEVGPHALLQVILKRNLNPEMMILPLQNWREVDQSVVFMRALGECHNAGVSVNTLALLEPVSLPVSPKTPSIGHLVTWDHSDEWFVPKPEDFTAPSRHTSNAIATTTIKIGPQHTTPEDICFNEYKIDNTSAIPAAYYLLAVWKTLAEFHSKPHDEFPVAFTNVTFHDNFSNVTHSSEASVTIDVLVSSISGYFEVTGGQKFLMSGKISKLSDPITYQPTVSDTPMKLMKLTKQDIYKELSLVGYQLGGTFQLLCEANLDLSVGELQIQMDSPSLWINFIDAPFHLGLLQQDSLSQPSSFQSLEIHPHNTIRVTQKPVSTLQWTMADKTYRTPGMKLTGLKFAQISRKALDIQPRIESYTFQPYFQCILEASDRSQTYSKAMVDIVLENNHHGRSVSILQIVKGNPETNDILTLVSEVRKSSSRFEIDHDVLVVGPHTPTALSTMTEHTAGSVFSVDSLTSPLPFHVQSQTYNLLIAEDMGPTSALTTTPPRLLSRISPGGFLLLKEAPSAYRTKNAGSPEKCISKDLEKLNFHCVAKKHCSSLEANSECVLLLYHHVPEMSDEEIAFVHVKDIETQPSLSWIVDLQRLLSTRATRARTNAPNRVYCISEHDAENPSGLVGMVNCLRLESYGDKLRCLYLFDTKWEDFKSTSTWQKVKAMDLLMNIVKNNQVGSFRHLPLEGEGETTDEDEQTSIVDFSPEPCREPPPMHETLPPKSGITVPTNKDAGAIPQTVMSMNSIFSPHKVYIITGGLGGFGLELSSWLVSRGVKHLILTSRSGVKTSYQARKLEKLKLRGVRVEVSNLNIANESQALALVQGAMTQGDGLGGVFHLAVVLRDCLFENQNAKRFEAVLKPKSTGAANLDKTMRKLSVTHSVLFVMFSSASSGLGNAGQTNYAFANSAMERLCEQRHSEGLHGLAIQWGAIGEVGILHERMGDKVDSVAGTKLQPIHSCLSSLDILLHSTSPVISCYIPALMSSSKTSNTPVKDDTPSSFKLALCRILGMQNPQRLKLDATLSQLGLDSLMNFEVKQLLSKDYSMVLSSTELLSMTVSDLIKKTSHKCHKTSSLESGSKEMVSMVTTEEDGASDTSGISSSTSQLSVQGNNDE